MGILYMIGTPIGNLSDITIRALDILKSVQLIACEDTRVTRKLLNHYDIPTKTISCNSHNWASRIHKLSEELDSGDIAYVTDAGMPSISDPGWEITSALRDLGHTIEVIPGVSSVTTALTISGFDASKFSFLGFLPRKENESMNLLSEHCQLGNPVVFFESPYRLAKTLARIETRFAGARITICRELTKYYEEIFNGTVQEAINHFSDPKGEIVIILHPQEETLDSKLDERTLEALHAEIARMKLEGVKSKEAISEISQKLKIRRNTIYQEWINS